MAKVKITLIKSAIGYAYDQKATVKALGLRKMNSFVIHESNPAILGMANKIRHLVKVEAISAESMAKTQD